MAHHSLHGFLLFLQTRFLLQRLSHGKRRFTLAQKVILRLVCVFVPSWKPVLFVMTPAALVKTSAQLFKKFWSFISQSSGEGKRKRISLETLELIRHMVQHNFWGAQRIHDELRRLGLPGSKRTIQKYMQGLERPPSPGGTWKTFPVPSHTQNIIQTDFTTIHPMSGLFLRPVFLK